MKKKRYSLILIIFLIAAICAFCLFLRPLQNDEIVVFYTNDVHSYIDNNIVEEGEKIGLTYSKVAALKSNTQNALLVDAGDHIQGTAYGSMDKGMTIIELMNASEFDVATLGNHEFDYGMSGCMAVIDAADFPYVSCNFQHETDGITGESVLDSYVIIKVGGKKLAFIGITTPESMSATTPAYFQDENGNYIYNIAGGIDGIALYNAVQSAIDAATADGADYIIALGHLGVDESSGPWTSRNVIDNVAGIDVFIDGHSHTTIEMETITDKSGNPVVLTQTGSYLDSLGKLTISPTGTFSTELLTAEDLETLGPEVDVKAIEDRWINSIQEQLGKVIGYAEITLDNYDAAGNRLVRKESTNSGDFAADALYYLFDEMGMDVDVAVMNGGGIRNNAITGELSYLTCKEIHTFGNVACLLQVTGQQILDALEWGSKGIVADGSGENGSLLHPAGMKYTLDLSYESTVQSDDKDIWIAPPTGEYRIKNVQILNRETGEYEPLNLDKTYNIAGYNYTLRDLGGGFAMLNGAVNVLDYVAEDYMVLANYIQSFQVDDVTGLPTIKAGGAYDDVTGSGRITIISKP